MYKSLLRERPRYRGTYFFITKDDGAYQLTLSFLPNPLLKHFIYTLNSFNPPINKPPSSCGTEPAVVGTLLPTQVKCPRSAVLMY